MQSLCADSYFGNYIINSWTKVELCMDFGKTGYSLQVLLTKYLIIHRRMCLDTFLALMIP